MTCKYLKKRLKNILAPEIGGENSANPPMPIVYCQLESSRTPEEGNMFWGTECNNTPYNGPCWFWRKKYPNEPDADFIQG